MSGRIYRNFDEAFNEIKRDLTELGIKVPPMYQSKDVSDNEDYSTMELSNYSYTVLDPDPDLVPNIHEEFVKQEMEDRLVGDLNPGLAYLKRLDVWSPLLERPQYRHEKDFVKFSYTYSQRMGGKHIQAIINELKVHPFSRQLYLPVWNSWDEGRRGTRRVPCSLGYWFVFRENQLHLTYMMRSCDYVTHMPNDVCLASLMLYYIAKKAGMEVGTFTHFVGSLHIYTKDTAGVF